MIQDADIAILDNCVGDPVGLELCGHPARVHFSEGVRARFGKFRVADKALEADRALSVHEVL
jgi:hypothetical protein